MPLFQELPRVVSELVEGWVLPFSTLAKILEYYGIGLLATSSEGKKRIGMHSDSGLDAQLFSGLFRFVCIIKGSPKDPVQSEQGIIGCGRIVGP